MEDFERVACVKNEVFVFKIPPRQSNRGYRAADWTLDKPDWTGRLRIITKGKELFIKLEDKSSGELFAQAPVDSYPGPSVEAVTDSSRYFVIQIKDPSGRTAFIGIGFTDRGDSFDFNVALQDHFKWIKQEKEIEKQNQEFFAGGPKLDLGFKEGQTISLNLGNKKSGEARSRPRPSAPSGDGVAPLLPPPPGSSRIARPSAGPSPQHTAAAPASQNASQPLGTFAAAPTAATTATIAPVGNAASGNSNADLLMDLDPFGSTSQQTSQSSSWGQF